MELPEELKKDKLVVSKLNDPSSVAYFNIYEVGDIWIKIKGCEGCPEENRRKCCKDCFKYTDVGCGHQIDSLDGKEKPFVCVSFPTPKSRISYCQIVFKCIEGKAKGNIIKVGRAVPKSK